LTRLFKFKLLDRYEVIMPALPRLPGLLKKKFKIITHRRHPQKTLFQFLSDYEQKIFHDHEKFDCDHVVLTADRGNLYMIFKRIYKRHLPFVKLYYVSNPGLFLQCLEDLRIRIPLALKTFGLVVDSRFLAGRDIPFKKNKNFYMPMIYKSDRLEPHEVDYLYSEFFLLGA
jgi:hypothetical protein